MEQNSATKTTAELSLVVISTTINGEKPYLAYDAAAHSSKFASIRFFIAGDTKGLPFDAGKMKTPTVYLSPDMQGKYYCSDALGWGTPARRNTALLAAMATNPDFILSINDDHIPGPDYFNKWFEVLTGQVWQTVNHETGSGVNHWHNHLRSADTPIELYPRGFPIPFRRKKTTKIEKLPTVILPQKIGLWHALSTGDPDVDEMTRIAYPAELLVKEYKEKNYCLQNIWSVYGAGNTVFSKTLFPLAFVWPEAGGFSDIYASLAWQKFLWNNGLHVFVGEPLHVHSRNAKDPLRVLELEVEGYFHSHAVWEHIDKVQEADPLKFIKNLTFSENSIITRQNKFFEVYLKDLTNIFG